VVEQTVTECAESSRDSDCRQAEEEHGYVMSEEEAHLKRVQAAFRHVIEQYVRNFSLKS
jgi:hypothetical protein